MSTTKRFIILLFVVALFGTTACADASGPHAETTCTENQGVGGRTCQ